MLIFYVHILILILILISLFANQFHASHHKIFDCVCVLPVINKILSSNACEHERMSPDIRNEE
jgi:hypothetical protein